MKKNVEHHHVIGYLWIPQSFVDDDGAGISMVAVAALRSLLCAKEAKRPCVICLTEKEQVREMGVKSSLQVLFVWHC